MDELEAVGTPNCPQCLVPLQLNERAQVWVCAECGVVQMS